MAVFDEREACEIVAAYLERLGVTGLRQRGDPTRVNRTAVLRYLLAEALAEALANPPLAGEAVARRGPVRWGRRAPGAGERPVIRRGRTRRQR